MAWSINSIIIFPALAAIGFTLWIGGWIVASVRYRHRHYQAIVPKVPARALFSERRVTGRSLDSFIARIAGASNCLLVWVIDEEVTVTPLFPFNLLFLPNIYGLEHHIPVSAITAIDDTRLGFMRMLRISWIDDRPHRIELRLRHADQFRAAIRSARRV